jgi:hypothetical protein
MSIDVFIAFLRTLHKTSHTCMTLFVVVCWGGVFGVRRGGWESTNEMQVAECNSFNSMRKRSSQYRPRHVAMLSYNLGIFQSLVRDMVDCCEKRVFPLLMAALDTVLHSTT